jgi:hypothetical protein
MRKSLRRKSARRKSRRKKSRKRKSRKRKFNVRRKAATEDGRSIRPLDRSANLKILLFATLHKDIGEAEKLKEIKGIMWPIEYKKEDPTRVDVNTKDEEDGDTALIMASYKGHLEIVKYLVEIGADVNAKNDEGDTALMGAIYNDRLEIVKYLVEHGADVNAKTENGVTVLMSATYNNNSEMVKFLVEHGAK